MKNEDTGKSHKVVISGRSVQNRYPTCAVNVVWLLLFSVLPFCSKQQTTGSLPVLDPDISPDGARLAFAIYGTLWTVPAQGGTAHELFHISGKQTQPKWSPDGKRIAFLNQESGTTSIVVYDLHEESAKTVYIGRRGIDDFCWDADGQSFLCIEQGQLLHVDTQKVRVVCETPGRIHDMDLSPDGTILAYSCRDRYENRQMLSQLWFVDVKSGDKQKLRENLEMILHLKWSPDGEQLVLSILRGGNNSLFLLSKKNGMFEGAGKLRQVTFHNRDEMATAWLPDGRSLIVQSNRSGIPNVYRLQLPQKKTTLIPITEYRWNVPTGTVNIVLVDAQNGSEIAGRVYVQAPDEKPYHPPDRNVYRNQEYFYNQTGKTPLTLPAGTYTISAAAGFEYTPQSVPVEIVPDKELELQIRLSNIREMNTEGWYSGETHIHANYSAWRAPYWIRPDNLMQLIESEHLNVGNSLPASAWFASTIDREQFTGLPLIHQTKPHILFYGSEFRSPTLGHMCLIGYNRWFDPINTGALFTPWQYEFPTHADIADSTHDRGGMVTYAHPIHTPPDPAVPEFQRGMGIAFTFALQKVDGYDMMSYPADELNSMDFFHRLLNCGFRVGVTAGTDVVPNRMYSPSVGGDRVYVKCAAPFNYENWAAGIKKGRTFVTNNPLLELRVNGEIPGSIIQLPSGARQQVDIQFSAVATAPMKELMLFWNGKEIVRRQLQKDSLNVHVNHTLRVQESGWISACVTGEKNRFVMDRYLFGYAGPVYIEYGNDAVDSPEDARYFLQLLDQLWNVLLRAEKWQTEDHRRHYRMQIERAKEYYRRQLPNI